MRKIFTANIQNSLDIILINLIKFVVKLFSYFLLEICRFLRYQNSTYKFPIKMYQNNLSDLNHTTK
jgi:putative component of membrane protein insertase Oxa1/YidC/SpoIIIJ protein YidD